VEAIAGFVNMPLVDVELSIRAAGLPEKIAAFLHVADERINDFLRESPVRGTGFVPSDYVTVYHALRTISEASLSTGRSFCEWGSGYGVAAALAAMLGFDACGIEIEGSLVDASRELTGDFDLQVDFVHGSFIPRGGEALAEESYTNNSGEFSWLVTEADDAYEELGLDPDDFDVVFTYPWPGDEDVIDNLFDRYAANGALLLTHGRQETLRLQRKVSGRATALGN